MIVHIRQPMPRKSGNAFYRDRNDYSGYAKSVCGAPITSLDIDFRTAGTKNPQTAPGTYLCVECIARRQA